MNCELYTCDPVYVKYLTYSKLLVTTKPALSQSVTGVPKRQSRTGSERDGLVVTIDQGKQTRYMEAQKILQPLFQQDAYRHPTKQWPAWSGCVRDAAFLGLFLLFCGLLGLTSVTGSAFLQPAPLLAQGTIPSPLVNIDQVAAGTNHTCGLTTTGGVKCWGGNGVGQLGDGTTIGKPRPVTVQGLHSGVTAISTGGAHTCALLQTGGVKCWGYNWAGQLGDGSTESRLTPITVSGLTQGIMALSTGLQHTCALTTTGSVLCWGRNDLGQLGDGSNTDRHTPVAVTNLTANITAISGGSGHTCALTTNGEIFCWGGNFSGPLGDGTTINRNTPVAVQGINGGIAAIHAGGGHTCALTTVGSILCWGANGSGQVGDGANINQTKPVAVQGLSSGVKALSAGGSHTCALTQTDLFCWGANAVGQLGNGTTIDKPMPTPVTGLASGVRGISAGNGYTCIVTDDGRVRCWGYNADGQLGDGTPGNHRMVTLVSGLDSGVTAVSASTDHTCALKATGAVLCWGFNGRWQLGDGTTFDQQTPVPVSGLNSGVTAISAGWFRTCAVNTTGGVLCWGMDAHGRLGDGTPVPVSGFNRTATAVSVGEAHACTLVTGGDVYCWGVNLLGQLGNGDNAEQQTPVMVRGLPHPVMAISTGWRHTCALTNAGAVYCWGDNSDGQLGDNTTVGKNSAVLVNGLSNGVSAISAGGFHTCAIIQTEGVTCWGDNSSGQMGNDTTIDQLNPIPINGLTRGVTTLSARHYYTCALRDDGDVWCWGQSDNGVYTDLASATPTLVNGLPDDVATISAGLHHTCVLTRSGSVHCWGLNDHGQLGDGSTWRTTAVDVIEVAMLYYLPLILR
ncbi:MAG: RCC1 repeat-containing protein [Caldilinea sp. CFX5]|nr:RCC1 repeat-containing protein [Caldilinea sp. CFX5]